ncbi:MAG: aspartate--ammonia ligase [Oscillospiraceae bacterium]
MSKITIPKDYKSKLNLYDTQAAIELVKSTFATFLCEGLNLKRVTAPLFVEANTGLNDNLSGKERAVAFDIPDANTEAQVVHSLAKWKRMALGKYDFRIGKGLYTDMNAIRRDEELSNIHSIYVDQWDWCKVISKEDRCTEYLKETVRTIVNGICDTLDVVKNKYPHITTTLTRDVTFVTTQELENMYPNMDGKGREMEFARLHKTIFVMQIGDVLKSGLPHDNRAPDYDDWKLNGDIIFWNELLEREFEISSMGIRVDEKSMEEQLKKANCNDRRELPFHKALLAGELPLTMGGGIGQSRLCMLVLGKAHIGEVQVSIWDEATKTACKNAEIELL